MTLHAPARNQGSVLNLFARQMRSVLDNLILWTIVAAAATVCGLLALVNNTMVKDMTSNTLFGACLPMCFGIAIVVMYLDLRHEKVRVHPLIAEL